MPNIESLSAGLRDVITSTSIRQARAVAEDTLRVNKGRDSLADELACRNDALCEALMEYMRLDSNPDSAAYRAAKHALEADYTRAHDTPKGT